MPNKFKILVVEDESNICSFVKTILEANDYQVLTAATCESALLVSSTNKPDLVILDLGLPDRDGLEFIRQTRLSDSLPILVLSARTDESDKVTALDLGANDYITKPFGTAELLARVRAALRNSRRSDAALPGRKFLLNGMVIDYDRRAVTIEGEEIRLTQTEYNILALMSQHTGKVLTYSFIIKQIWGFVDDSSTKKLQVNMSNLRKKLGSKPGDNRFIINELGVGYRIQDEL